MSPTTLPLAGPGVPAAVAVWLPSSRRSPLRLVLTRLGIALLGLAVMITLVYVDREGYRDSADNSVSLLDAVYYATVSLSTTGYGDITPVTDAARLVNVLLVTPLRILFLIALVGTTIQTLTEHSRDQIRLNRWGRRVRDHTVIIGFGTKGRSAARTLLADGTDPGSIVAVDASPAYLHDATAMGLTGVSGDATRLEVLEAAHVARAKQVIVATARDDTSVLVVLTVRQLNRTATVVAASREAENVDLLEQSGADAVITSSDAAGRLLGLTTLSPTVGHVLDDLLVGGSGLEVAERPVTPAEVGVPVRRLPDRVLAVWRDGSIFRFDDPAVSTIEARDRLVCVVSVGPPHARQHGPR